MAKQRKAANGNTTPSSKASKGAVTIPPPFAPAPAAIQPFCEYLDRETIYLTHIDPFPAAFKQRIFTVPVLLNVAIIILLAARVWAILPTYANIGMQALGNEVPGFPNTKNMTWGEFAPVALKRSGNITLDYLLVTIILPWPISFFFEWPANPVRWRWNVGFRDQEIVVRESRKWGAKDLLEGEKTGKDSAFWRNRVLPAIEPSYLKQKTGYVMMGRDWDLDFERMIVATKMADMKEGEEEHTHMREFRTRVLMYMPEVGWLNYMPGEDEEGGVDEEEARKKIVEFKDRLTMMGKESLFFRWIELLQYQTSLAGDFDAKRKGETIEKARKMFAEQGIDFDTFIDRIGGVDGMPGMEQQQQAG